jgi:hypothetical protein
MKKFMERTQPALLPFIDNEGGGTMAILRNLKK